MVILRAIKKRPIHTLLLIEAELVQFQREQRNGGIPGLKAVESGNRQAKFFHLLLEEGESFVRDGLLQASAVEIDAFLKNKPLHLVLRRGAEIDFKDQPLRLLVGLFDGRLERIVFLSQRVN